jgi:hypothetical protein
MSVYDSGGGGFLFRKKATFHGSAWNKIEVK